VAQGRLSGFAARVGIVLVGLLAAGALALWGAQLWIDRAVAPDAATIASASLAGLREQNRLSAFAARFVAVVTSKQTRLGLTAERTLIMPGNVRYEVDLARLGPGDVRWDKGSGTLSVTLPPVRVTGPEIDFGQVREYGQSGLLTTFTDARAQLDQLNRVAGQRALLTQANAPVPMGLARDATRRAVAQSFALPLRAVGVTATVRVRFADERSNEIWDMSRPIDQVLREQRR